MLSVSLQLSIPPEPIADRDAITGKFTLNTTFDKVGGGLGVVTALIAYYVGLAELLIRDESWFTLPLGVMPRRLD